ncbi:Cthe_2314 family HEPN domain-containing protein [Flavobacterium panacagri]|uniref:Cthe_2314 family HEPN domain-containing protein n=1 Tax=Flavobacterium panacagri TaxID=3034146 RepID=UPI0025A687DF|nr:Cthe_2314 family HEPN domain-containing protein [Flavobacterium panacagri]
MEITEFNDKLVKEFFEIVNRTMEEVHEHPDYSRSGNNHHLLSPEGKYANKVFGIYLKIKEIKEDLRKIEIFLRRFPLKKFYEENEISHLDYIKYHTEVFYHKSNTLLDLFKLFTNEVYELGYSEKKCTWNNLMKSEAVKDSLSIKVIEYYHKSFEHIIEARNLNTHRGIFKDSKKDDIEAPMMIYKNSEKFNLELNEVFRKMMPKFLLEYKIKKYKNERLLFIKSGNNAAEQYINFFMNVTLPEFLNRAKAKQ